MYIPQPVAAVLDSWLTGGFKAARYVLSPKYRQRVHDHWQIYPQLRMRGIIRMVWGTIFDVAILWGLLQIQWHR